MNPVSGGAISPNGGSLAYSDSKGVHVKHLDTGETRDVRTGPGWNVTAWFPDNDRILANTSEGVWILRAAGGDPQKLMENAFGWSVSPDGARVAVTTREKLALVEVRSGRETILEALQPSRAQWSPDGKRIAYRSGQSAIRTVAAEGGTTVQIATHSELRDFCWLPDGLADA